MHAGEEAASVVEVAEEHVISLRLLGRRRKVWVWH
jgi:hypothetical protein